MSQSGIFLHNPGATAGNAVSTYTVPAGKPLKFLYGHVRLTTDVTVANRRVSVAVYNNDGTPVLIYDEVAGAVVPASQTSQHISLVQGIFRETSFVGGAVQLALPKDLYLLPGWTFRISVQAGAAGDSFVPTVVFGD